jgi:hypothetical protein
MQRRSAWSTLSLDRDFEIKGLYSLADFVLSVPARWLELLSVQSSGLTSIWAGISDCGSNWIRTDDNSFRQILFSG